MFLTKIANFVAECSHEGVAIQKDKSKFLERTISISQAKYEVDALGGFKGDGNTPRGFRFNHMPRIGGLVRRAEASEG